MNTNSLLDIYKQEIQNCSYYSKEEQRELISKAKMGDKASRDKLILGAAKFVIKTVQVYKGLGVPEEDLIGYGNLGLCKAVDKFDLSYNVSFLTYARFWIMEEIKDALVNAKLIRLPNEKNDYLRKLINAEKDFIENGCDSPSIEMLANATGVNLNIARMLYVCYRDIYSLDFSMVDESDSRQVKLSDFIADIQQNTENKFDQKDLEREIHSLVGILDNRERCIVLHKTGLFGMSIKTFEELGRSISLTGEAARQIYKRALSKLYFEAKNRDMEIYLSVA